MVIRFLIALSLFVSFSGLAALTATVDRNPVLAGEFFILTIESDQGVKGQPDTSVLLKDFVVGPVSNGSHTSIINGRMTRKTTWQLELMARKPGKYTIPSFTIKNDVSEPISLTVLANDETDKQKDAFIEVSLSNASIYVQQALVYTAKLYLAKELREGGLGDPVMEGAQISQIGQTKSGFEIINGVRYAVYEKEYLIQPQQSGEFTIKGPVFRGRLNSNYRLISASAIGEDLTIDVKPIPDSITGNWLPSELVTLEEAWQPAKQEYKVGEPITRTVTLTALGVTKEQLPEISMSGVQGLRAYSDKGEVKNAVRSGRVISQRIESFAILPQVAGVHTLPEVRIEWFNVITNQLESARLPQREITIIANPDQVAVTPPQTNVVSSEVTPVQTAIEPQVAQGETSDITELTLVHYLIAGLGYVLWIITLLILLLKPNAKPIANSAHATGTPSDNTLSALTTLAKQQDPKGFYTAWLNYQRTHKLDNAWLVTNHPDIASELHKLQQQLYGDKQAKANLTTIAEGLAKLTKQTKRTSQLSELY
jgi:hypothetical protein